MKRINKKGFTLIELLAVIVVLAIILVITVPTVLNTLSSTRQDALDASAASTAKYYKNQIGMYQLGKKQDKFMIDIKMDYSTGKVQRQTERSISVEEADILGLNDDYSINQSCTGTSSLSSACNDTTYSTVSWNTEGEVTVKLVGANGGKFMNGSTSLASIYNTTNGKNMFDGVLQNGAYANDTGEYGTNFSGYICNKYPIFVESNKVYTIKHNAKSGVSVYVLFYNNAGNFIGKTTVDNTGEFTTPSNTKYINFNISGSNISEQGNIIIYYK